MLASVPASAQNALFSAMDASSTLNDGDPVNSAGSLDDDQDDDSLDDGQDDDGQDDDDESG